MSEPPSGNRFMTDCTAVRGPLLHFTGDPGNGEPDDNSYQYFDDGVLVIRDGRVVTIGAVADMLPRLASDTSITHWPDRLIVPGFIDTHVHMPQLDIIASYGGQLLDWLERYAFPAEARFADGDWCRRQSRVFLDMLLAHGTTSALVFSTSHSIAAESLFSAADELNMAITTGKVMMDRHAPDDLRDEAAASERDSQQLIDRWHGHRRQRYAVTPRFAATSSPDQLSRAGRLLANNPGVLMQTHWAESLAEITWTRDLFPDRSSYLDIYRHYGLLGDHSVLAHGLHISNDDRQLLADTGTRIAFCPTSNTFLGSGLFDLAAARQAEVKVGLASDVGGGTSLSMFATMAEAYKVCQLRGQSLSPFQAFYMATLGNAEVLHQAADTGNLAPGKMADFLVLDPHASPILSIKQRQRRTLTETLFDLMILGDDRVIARTYMAGECQYRRAF